MFPLLRVEYHESAMMYILHHISTKTAAAAAVSCTVIRAH